MLQKRVNCLIPGRLGLVDPDPGDLHRDIHAVRGRLPAERARL